MKAGHTHDVVVWVGTKPGETNFFTLTARDADGNRARMLEVEEQVAEGDFIEDYREVGMTKEKAEERKSILKAEYKLKGFKYQPRNSLPNPMKK